MPRALPRALDPPLLQPPRENRMSLAHKALPDKVQMNFGNQAAIEEAVQFWTLMPVIHVFRQRTEPLLS